MCATKVNGFKGLSYSERLKKLNLPNFKILQAKRQCDLFNKMLKGKYSSDACIILMVQGHMASYLTQRDHINVLSENVNFGISSG